VTRKNFCYSKGASYSLYFGSGISVSLHASSLSLQLAFLAFQMHIPHYPSNSNIQNVSKFSAEYRLSNFRVMSYLSIDGNVQTSGRSSRPLTLEVKVRFQERLRGIFVAKIATEISLSRSALVCRCQIIILQLATSFSTG
jgi:hypothetical protein